MKASSPLPTAVVPVDKNSIAYWFPLLEQTGVRVPKTVMIHTDLDLDPLLDGEEVPGLAGLCQQIGAAAEAVGPYPVFLRTGHGSGKHAWSSTCYLMHASEISTHVFNLVEWSATVDIAGLPTDTWAVRTFVPLHASFSAFHGMPVARERRYFIHNGVVQCSHPYWPKESIFMASAENWPVLLEELDRLTSDELDTVSSLATQVAESFKDEGYWSLDLAQARDGSWLALDMAQGLYSYHAPSCQYA